jgi:hypothetical protein
LRFLKEAVPKTEVLEQPQCKISRKTADNGKLSSLPESAAPLLNYFPLTLKLINEPPATVNLTMGHYIPGN